MLNWTFDWQHILVGVIASLIVSTIFGYLPTEHIYKFVQVRRYYWMVVYILKLSWEMFKANLDVAYRVVHPALPIHPGIVKVKTKLKTNVALTFLSNSITLTPGTFVIDVDKENGFLYVHWINVISEDMDTATRLIVKRFEDILSNMLE